jgi:hypothetical protein
VKKIISSDALFHSHKRVASKKNDQIIDHHHEPFSRCQRLDYLPHRSLFQSLSLWGPKNARKETFVLNTEDNTLRVFDLSIGVKILLWNRLRTFQEQQVLS